MIRLSIVFACFFAITPSLAPAQGAAGLWRTEATDQGYLEVKVAPCAGGNLCGTIIRARDLQGQEQPYPHSGKRMIWDMAPKSDTVWEGGRIWDPRNNRTFASRMTLAGNQLNVSGCFIGICQAQTWQRVQ